MNCASASTGSRSFSGKRKAERSLVGRISGASFADTPARVCIVARKGKLIHAERSTLAGTTLDDEEFMGLALKGPAARKQYLDVLEGAYGEELKAGNARARRLLAELVKSHGGASGTPLSKEFFERLLPLLPKADQLLFLKGMQQEAQLTAHKALEEAWPWWRRLWQRL